MDLDRIRRFFPPETAIPSSVAQAAKFYERRNCLVTGGASFIGSFLVELLVELGAEVIVADDLSSGKLENLSSVLNRIRFIQADLSDRSAAEAACRGQDVVFHLAAAHGGRGYIQTHPVECLGNLALDHGVLFEAARAGAKKLVFASSACVYPTRLQGDEAQGALLREAEAGFDRPGQAFPDGEYGWAKLMGELQLRSIHRQYGIDAVSCRIFTAYGERENETHAAIALIAKALARLDPFPIWGDGRQTRNFTYVADTAVGLALAGALLKGHQTVNVGGSKHHSIHELLSEIFDCVGWKPAKIQTELERPVGVRSRAADNTHCRETLGWEPQWAIKAGVGRTVEWYRALHPRGLDPAELERRLWQRAAEFRPS